ncbi:acyltransferase family protein [Arthrobacter bambusae]
MKKIVEPLPSWGRRLAGIEGLRAAAALSVLAYHVGLMASDEVHLGPVGQVFLPLLGQGLPLFFVLSGFLLFRPFATSIMRGKELPSIRRYAANRLLRIYPAYLVILGATALVMGSVYIKGSTHGFGPDNIGRLTEPIKFLANALLVHMFIPQFVMSGLPVAWSLTAEITFYVAVPLMALLSARLVRLGTSKAVALAIAPVALVVIGLGVTSWGHAAADHLDYTQRVDFAFGQTGTAVLLRSFLGQADLFGYGIAAALVVVALDERGVQRVAAWVKVVLLAAAVAAIWAGMSGTMPYLSNMAGVASALVLLAVVLPSSRDGGANRLALLFEWRPIRFTGTISYSIYLWHLPVIFWLMTHKLTVGGTVLALPFNTILVLGIVLPLSALTYYLVERPAMLRKKPSPQGESSSQKVPLATSAVP